MNGKEIKTGLNRSSLVRLYEMYNFCSSTMALPLILILGLGYMGNCMAYGSPSQTTMHTNNWAVLVCTSRYWLVQIYSDVLVFAFSCKLVMFRLFDC